MLWKLDGVAFIGLHESAPRTIDVDRCGRPCEGEHECITGAVRPISYAPSREHGAVAIHRVRPDETPEDVARRLSKSTLRYQPVEGELEVVQVRISALVADERGRGEPPWDRMADLDEEIAIELRPRLQGIRELRLRESAMDRISWGEPIDFEPAAHAERIVAIARKGG